MSKPVFLGWAGAHNRWRDPTGVAHAIIVLSAEALPIGRPACGSEIQVYGQVEKTPLEAAGVGFSTDSAACKRCLKYVVDRGLYTPE